MNITKSNDGVITIRQARPEDLILLQSVCRRSYIESFADHWEQGGLEWYLDKVYGTDVLQRDLNDPLIMYFMSYYEGTLAGFMKLKLNSTLTTALGGSHLEIEKLYFLVEYQRKGLGKRLIELAKQLADDLRVTVIWLAVIDSNTNAIAFYEQNGFVLFDKTRLEIPYFKDNLRGMWRMIFQSNIKKG